MDKLVVTMKQGVIAYTVEKTFTSLYGRLPIEVTIPSHLDGVTIQTEAINKSTSGEVTYCKDVELPRLVDIAELMPFLAQSGWHASARKPSQGYC